MSKKAKRDSDDVETTIDTKPDRPSTPGMPRKKKQGDDDVLSIVYPMENLDVTNVKNPRKSHKLTPPVNGSNQVYLCVRCDKSYKSKSGVKKHMVKCDK